MQMISLVQRLLEFSSSKKNFEQHKLDKEFTANENANLCHDLISITKSSFFRLFDTQKMLNALLTSKVFTNTNL
jgi:hypothetical protein